MREMHIEEPQVSVIILNYNGKAFIAKCLSSVLKSDYSNFEVILVDNGSTDGSIEMTKELFSGDRRLKVIENSRNLGFAEGNNVGARHARGEYIVFLNVDTEVDQGWLRELVKVMASDSKIGAAQCKLLLAQDKSRLESAGHYIDYVGIESVESTIVLGEVDRGQYDRVRDIFYARGAAMAIKKYVFFKAGMFDPAYFIDHEEIDLCWRIRLSGYRVVFVPRSIVYHYGSAIAGKREDNPFILFNLRKNHIMSLLKNYELRNVLKYLPIYVTFLAAHALFSTVKDKKSTVFAYFKAILWILINFRYIYAQRLRVQRLVRRVPDSEVMKCMVPPRIPWHFLR
jgi:GT2 family glycosyltransferase